MDAAETRGKRPDRLFFLLFAIEIPTMVIRVAALIVLSVFVVYFIRFIGSVGHLSRGENVHLFFVSAVPYPCQ